MYHHHLHARRVLTNTAIWAASAWCDGTHEDIGKRLTLQVYEYEVGLPGKGSSHG